MYGYENKNKYRVVLILATDAGTEEEAEELLVETWHETKESEDSMIFVKSVEEAAG